jgi:hypothetical protein
MSKETTPETVSGYVSDSGAFGTYKAKPGWEVRYIPTGHICQPGHLKTKKWAEDFIKAVEATGLDFNDPDILKDMTKLDEIKNVIIAFPKESFAR